MKDAWGVFVGARADLNELRTHLRRFLLLKGPEGKEFYFRFYDPRVLRVYLPSCRPSELEMFFGPVDAFLTEAEDPADVLEFRREGDLLIQSHPARPLV